MAYRVNTRAELLQDLAEDRSLDRGDIRPRVLESRVWVGMVSIGGGYMPHAHYYGTSRESVIESLVDHAEQGDGKTRGMKTHLRQGYAFRTGGELFELNDCTARELF